MHAHSPWSGCDASGGERPAGAVDASIGSLPGDTPFFPHLWFWIWHGLMELGELYPTLPVAPEYVPYAPFTEPLEFSRSDLELGQSFASCYERVDDTYAGGYACNEKAAYVRDFAAFTKWQEVDVDLVPTGDGGECTRWEWMVIPKAACRGDKVFSTSGNDWFVVHVEEVSFPFGSDAIFGTNTPIVLDFSSYNLSRLRANFAPGSHWHRAGVRIVVDETAMTVTVTNQSSSGLVKGVLAGYEGTLDWREIRGFVYVWGVE